MRVFQNSAVYPGYAKSFDRKYVGNKTFNDRKKAFFEDRFGVPHFLKPVLDNASTAFFTNGDDLILQKFWAREHGLSNRASLEDILLAQIEAHRTEVFYNLDPIRYDSRFLKRLPSSVKYRIAWRAAPHAPSVDFSTYDRIVSNFPSILATYRNRGLKVSYFAPSCDPEMSHYAQNSVRPIDVLFVGTYSRHHSKRAALLEVVASISKELNIVFHLECSLITKMADSPFGYLPSLKVYRRPASIRSVSQQSIFGLDLYESISRAKIVLNGAIDFAGEDRGNMRCFEAMGCGALLLSDAGNYPLGFMPGENMLTYINPEDALNKLMHALKVPSSLHSMANAGTKMLSKNYSKEDQWKAFEKVVSDI